MTDPLLKRVTIYRAGRPTEELDEPDVVAGDLEVIAGRNESRRARILSLIQLEGLGDKRDHAAYDSQSAEREEDQSEK